ncbi:MAG TPA: sulfocyanin-like copper-binding protein [Dehalococcoidia bacterium]
MPPTPTVFSGTVNVTESEFKIQADPKVSPDTDISFILRNEGTMPHQFIVLKTDLAPDKLPTQGSPSQVNLSDNRLTVIYQYPAYPAGQANLIHLNLDPGHYVFICNLPGHYALGMRTDFSVSESNQGGGNSP